MGGSNYQIIILIWYMNKHNDEPESQWSGLVETSKERSDYY